MAEDGEEERMKRDGGGKKKKKKVRLNDEPPGRRSRAKEQPRGFFLEGFPRGLRCWRRSLESSGCIL